MKRKIFTSLSVICALAIATVMPVFAAEKKCIHKNAEKYPAIEAECDAAGYTAGIYCKDCEEWVSGHDEIDAIGHIDSNKDNICDDCHIKFTLNAAKEASCETEGHTGSKEKSGRLFLGDIIPKLGHKDVNKDFVCDRCGTKITKEKINVTLHYYVTTAEYEKNKSHYNGKNFTVKTDCKIPSCVYIIERRIENEHTEFMVPAFPKVFGQKFVWMSKNKVYTTFNFDEDIDLYMAYKNNDIRLDGQCGDNVYWQWHPEEELLEFTGFGTVWNTYNSKEDIPWYVCLTQNHRITMDNKVRISLWAVTP